MSDFIANTEKQTEDMLLNIGVKSIDELFSDIKPGLRPKSFNLPQGKSEFEVTKHLKDLAAKNATDLICFVGAGFYDHYIPSVVDHLASRSEFYTAYTPYQAEVAQGTLATIYEFQSILCELTGMDVANASVYDGGSAAAEAGVLFRRSCATTGVSGFT